MPLAFEPAGDLQCCDGLETVTLRLSSTSAPLVVTGALRRGDETSEAEPSNGAYLATDVRWHLPADQVPTEPTIGATITTADGTRYVVLSAARTVLAASCLCRTRNLAIVSGLERQVVLQQGVWTKGASGAQVATWHNVRMNLAARIQPVQGDITIEYDRRRTRVTHRVFVADDVVVDHTFRIVSGTEVYGILGFERQERLDALGVILTEQISGATA